tara:strand:- start:35477 stop:36202 length:726 start_codon:yes stop_codon:yes gene_type:complete
VTQSIEIISLVYKSKSYLDFICSQLASSLCKADGWDVSARVVGNNPAAEILNALPDCGTPYSVYNDPEPEAYYLERVYRCWNHAVQTSRYDNVCLVNSDMAFSPDWLDNLLKHHDGVNIPCSRLVESGKLDSGQHGIDMDFGRTPSEFRVEEFTSFATYVSQVCAEIVKPGGLFMPVVFNREQFLSRGGYPEGNQDAGAPGEKSGDAYFFNDILEQRYVMKHVTAFDSVVYHIQEGEQDAP